MTTVKQLRVVIFTCAANAKAAEPRDINARARSFVARLCGQMAALGASHLEEMLDQVLGLKPEPEPTASNPAEPAATAPVEVPAQAAAPREPTSDEQLGMDWWNSLSEERRAYWLAKADSAAPFAAWRAFRAAEDDLALEA